MPRAEPGIISVPLNEIKEWMDFFFVLTTEKYLITCLTFLLLNLGTFPGKGMNLFRVLDRTINYYVQELQFYHQFMINLSL